MDADRKSTSKGADMDERDELEDLQGLSSQDVNGLRFQQAEDNAPTTAQQEADQQADMWHTHWGAALERDVLQWPDDMGEELPELLVEELCEAANTFPDETGLGWDKWHPKVLCRLSLELVHLFVIILM